MSIQHDFAGKVVVVTGAGRGIGCAIAQYFARSNARVLAVDRRPEGLARWAGSTPGVRTQVCDLCEEQAPAAVMASASQAFGQPIAALVNNAGAGTPGAVHNTSDDAWDRSLDINLRTVFRLSRAALPWFGANGGSIVNLASIFGMVGVQGFAPYSAAKAAIIGLTQQMAAEYGPQHIRVNAVAPGLIATPATAPAIASNPLFEQALVQRTPLGRIGSPADVAAAVAFLASEDASFITGHTLVVDGGWSSTHFMACAQA